MNLRSKFSGKWVLKPGRLADLRATAASLWAARNRRERALLAIGAAVVLLGLLYLLLIDPALQGRAQLRKNLPVVRLQSVQLQALANQAAALPAAVAPDTAGVGKESIEALLRKNGLQAQSVAWSGDSARLQFAEVPFGALLDALQALQKATRLAVVEARITATAVTGSVDASLTLRAPKAD